MNSSHISGGSTGLAALPALEPAQASESAKAAGRTIAPQTTQAVAHADSTSLSASSNLIRGNDAVDDVRHDKVAELQAAIASGTYHVSSAQLADKLISALLR